MLLIHLQGSLNLIRESLGLEPMRLFPPVPRIQKKLLPVPRLPRPFHVPPSPELLGFSQRERERERVPPFAGAVFSNVHPSRCPDFSRVIGALTPKRTVMHPILVKGKTWYCLTLAKSPNKPTNYFHLISPNS
jgi:hypothetical protein